MDFQLLLICALTFIIHLIGTLAYAVRIAGVRTRRLAMTFALFNILVLLSRTSNSFQAPFLAKRVENQIALPGAHDLLADFRWLLLSASLATVLGALLIPTFQRLFSRAVLRFQHHRSLWRLVRQGFATGGWARWREVLTLPAGGHLRPRGPEPGVSRRMVLLNGAAVALWTVGVFAALYAGYLQPEVRSTASNLSALINGGATILMFVFIDPQLAIMTDDVMSGRVTEPVFRRNIVWLTGSRFAGTLLAQALLLPAATAIAFVARGL